MAFICKERKYKTLAKVEPQEQFTGFHFPHLSNQSNEWQGEQIDKKISGGDAGRE